MAREPDDRDEEILRYAAYRKERGTGKRICGLLGYRIVTTITIMGNDNNDNNSSNNTGQKRSNVLGGCARHGLAMVMGDMGDQLSGLIGVCLMGVGDGRKMKVFTGNMYENRKKGRESERGQEKTFKGVRGGSAETSWVASATESEAE